MYRTVAQSKFRKESKHYYVSAFSALKANLRMESGIETNYMYNISAQSKSEEGKETNYMALVHKANLRKERNQTIWR